MKNLSLTVGITTCFGDNSILDTVKSIRASSGLNKFRFIIVADRVPINPHLKKELRKYGVELIENEKEGSQLSKQRQILSLTKTDLILLTQDDVLVDTEALETVINRFQDHPQTTFISIRNEPVPATNWFEGVLGVGTHLANRIAGSWRNGDNYLSVIGRFMIFRVNLIKKIKIREEVATTDAYYYFSNKFLGGVYEYISQVAVYFKNPQNMTEHLRKSSRFQFSKAEMGKYFGNLDSEYQIPAKVVVRAILEQFLANPFKFTCYLAIFLYTRILKLKPSYVLNALWEVDLSTKKVLTG